MGVRVRIRRAVTTAGLLTLAVAVAMAAFGDKAHAAPAAPAAPRDSLLCPPPPILSGLISAIPIPITGLTCALGAADIELVTTYKRPNGSLVTKRFRTLAGIPTLVNVDDDILPDITVWPQVLSTKNFRLIIDRGLLEFAQLPLKVDIVVNDPTGGALPRDRIHGGYDALQSAAPTKFRTDINLGDQPNGDTKVNLVTFVTPKAQGNAVAIQGGLFDGDALARQNHLGGTGTYTPVPSQSSLTLSIGELYKLELTTNAPTTLDAAVELIDGGARIEQRGKARIDKLPTSLVVDYIPGATEDQRTVKYAASSIVGALDASYRQTEAGVQTLGAVIHATGVPTNMTIEQTKAKAGSISTNGALNSLEVGMANGEPVLNIPSTGPYVKMFSSGAALPEGGWEFNSVAARIDGLKRASIDATDAITADVEVTPAGRKPVTLDVEDPTLTIDGTVDKLPEHLTLTADFDGPVITYDGHGQGLDDIRIDATQTTPFFGRATEIHAHGANMAPLFTFELDQIHVEPVPGFVLNEGVEVTSTEPIGLVEFEATDGTGGSALPVPYQDPETGDTYDTGAVYVDTPSRFAIGARAHNFERLLFNRRFDSTMTLGTTTAAERMSLDISLDTFDLPLEPDDAMTAKGVITVLPHDLTLMFRTPSDTNPGIVDVDASAAISDVSITVDRATPFIVREGAADPHTAFIQIKDIPAQLHADIEATTDGAAVVLDHAIGMVEFMLTSGPGINLGGFGEASGVAARMTEAEFVALGRLHNVKELRFTSSPLSIELHATETQGFLLDITVDDPDDLITTPGHITGEIAALPTDLTITKYFNRIEWDASTGVPGENAVTMSAEYLPSGATGKLNDGGVHFLELEIDDLPKHFNINAGDTPIGVDAVEGAFGRIFVQVSDAPAALLSDPDPDDPGQFNQVLLEAADDTEGDPGFLTAFLRVYDLQTANYYFYSDYLKTVDVVFSEPEPAMFRVGIDTTTADVQAEIGDPPQEFTLDMDTEDDTLVGWTASDETDVDISFALFDAVGGDLEIANIPTSADFCLSTADMGCESQFEQPHGVDSGCCLYNIPTVFHTYLRTQNETAPLVLNGLLCLKPDYSTPLPTPENPNPTTPVWDPVCDFEGGDMGGDVANSWHRVRFTDVTVSDFQIDLVSGRSFTPDDEDDLIGGYMDFPSFTGRVTYWENVIDEPETLDQHSRIIFESIGAEPFTADGWEFIVDTTGGVSASQIFLAGDNDCGSDSKLEMWVATQFSDLFEIDDATSEVDLCTD